MIVALARRLRVPLLLIAMRIGTLASKFLLIVFITHFLGLEVLGQFALLGGAAAILPTVLGFGLITHIAREGATQSLAQATENMSVLWQWSIVFYLLLALFAVPISVELGWAQLTIAALALGFLGQVNEGAMNLLINRDRPIAANILFTIRIAGWAYAYMVVAAFVPEVRTFTGLIAFWLLGEIVSVGLFALMTASWPWRIRHVLPSTDWLFKNVKRSWLFWLHDSSDAISANVDRFVISVLLSVELTGVYVFFWQIGNSIRNVVLAAVYRPQQAAMIQAFADGHGSRHKAQTIRVCKEVVVISLALMAAAELTLIYALPYLGRPMLEAHLLIFPVILVAVLVRTVADMLANSLFTARRDRAFVASSLIALGLATLGNLMLVPVLGMVGSAVAALLVALVAGLWRFAVMRQVWSDFPGRR